MNESHFNEYDERQDHKSQAWIEPFINTSKRVPCIDIMMDNKQTVFTVDTGATRVLVTSALAQELWNSDYKKKLRKFPNIEVQDAQGNTVQV